MTPMKGVLLIALAIILLCPPEASPQGPPTPNFGGGPPLPITTVDHAYTVFVKTSDDDGAGTNAKVSIALPRSKPPWSFRELDNKDVDDFEAGQTDRFFVQLPVETLRGVPPVTWPVERLALEHDNTGDRPGWFVEWVKICDGKVSKPTNACRTFTFNRWLATDEGDKQLVAEGRL